MGFLCSRLDLFTKRKNLFFKQKKKENYSLFYWIQGRLARIFARITSDHNKKEN